MGLMGCYCHQPQCNGTFTGSGGHRECFLQSRRIGSDCHSDSQGQHDGLKLHTATARYVHRGVLSRFWANVGIEGDVQYQSYAREFGDCIRSRKPWHNSSSLRSSAFSTSCHHSKCQHWSHLPDHHGILFLFILPAHTHGKSTYLQQFATPQPRY